MKKTILVILLIVSIFAISGCVRPIERCTMDTKICPDGSSIERTGIYCEFMACPDIIIPTNNTILNTTSLLPCLIDFSASTFDSSLYPYYSSYIELGTLSDWMNYDPLKQQVNALTSELDSDEAKFKAIGSWVSHSKKYSHEFEQENNPEGSVANNFGSVIQIYDSKEGVCMDAAILSVAMLRMANIPSRVIYPIDRPKHIQTQAYIQGKWITLDSTFEISQKDSITYNILVYPFSTTTTYLGTYSNMDQYFDNYIRTNSFISGETYIFKTITGDLPTGELVYKSISKGYPVNNNISSKDALSDYYVDFDLTRIDSKKIWFTKYNNSFLLSEIRPQDICSNGTCSIYEEISAIDVLKNNYPRVLIKDLNNNKYLTGAAINAEFIGKVKLPVGKYRFYVTIRESNDKQELAYAEINIIENELTTFSPTLLKLSNGADKDKFDALIKRYNTKLDCLLIN